MTEPEVAGWSILRTGALIYSIKALTIMVSLGTWAVLAFLFGTGLDIEAYFAAVIAYDLAGRMMQPGAAASVLVPVFIRAKTANGMESAWALVSMVLNTMSLGVLALMALLMVAIPWIAPLLVPGFDTASQANVVTLVRVMAIAMVSLPVIAIANAVLNANGQFARPEIFLLVGSITFLATIAIGVPLVGVVAVAVATVLNAAVTLTGTLVSLQIQGYRHRWLLKPRDSEFRDWVRALRPSFGYMVVMQPCSFVLTAVLSMLPPGSMAIYRYASELTGRIGLYVSGPVGTMALPALSRIAESQGKPELSKAVAQSLKLALIISLPVAFIIFLASEEILRLFLNYGQFTEQDVRPVATAMVILAITVVFQSVNAVMQRTFVVIQRTGWQNIVMVLGQVYTLTLVLILIPTWGYVGAAWHNVLALLALLVTGFVVLLANKFAPDWSVLKKATIGISLAGAAAFGSGWAVGQADISPSWLGLLAIASAVSVTYVAVGWIFRVDEARLAVATVVDKGRFRSNHSGIFGKL